MRRARPHRPLASQSAAGLPVAKAKIDARQAGHLYGLMDRRLADHAFFAGEELSIADFAIVGWVWRHERHKIELADFPNVQRWYRGMMARDAVGRGFAVQLRRASS